MLMEFDEEWNHYYKEVPESLYNDYLNHITIILLQDETRLKIMIDHLNEIEKLSDANFKEIDDLFDVFTKVIVKTC